MSVATLSVLASAQRAIAAQRPDQMAAAPSVVASDLPGWDCADRAYLRRVALALQHSDGEQARKIALAALDARASCGAKRARPEGVLVEAVFWLLQRQASDEAGD